MVVKNGFSLVEVLVASLVIVLGVTGYVTLQSQYVVANSNLNLRSVAIRLADDKLSDLQFFHQLKDSELSYTNIITNGGGTIPFGDREISLSTNAAHTHAFNTSWQVNQYFYVDTDLDEQPDKWVKSGDDDYPKTLPQFSHMKSISITVQWADLEGKNKMFILSGAVAPIAMGRSFQALYRTPSSTAKP